MKRNILLKDNPNLDDIDIKGITPRANNHQSSPGLKTWAFLCFINSPIQHEKVHVKSI
jgi:hypothetical protein